jgi:hypothetical protein
MFFPNRPMQRMLMDEPNSTRSNTESALPARTHSTTDIVDPTRAKPRRENEDPNSTKSITEIFEPNRATERTLIVEPIFT